jgi:hypothetical protein
MSDRNFGQAEQFAPPQIPGEQLQRPAAVERPAVPYGDNPYFPTAPTENAAPEGDGDQWFSEDGSGESAPAAPQGQEIPDPTFNEEQDRALGFDVTDPVYRKALALLAKAPPAETELEVETKALDARKRLAEEQQAQGQDDSVPTIEVSWEGFQINPLPQDDPLAGHEDKIARIVREHVDFAIATVNRQNKQFVETTKLTQTRDYISNVIDEIGKVGGTAAKSKALDLLQEYAPFAKTAPQKWARFVVTTLGITPETGQSAQGEPKAPVASPAKESPNGNKIRQQVQARSIPPSAPRSGASAVRKPQFSGKTATQDAVAWALDQSIAGKI